MASCPHPPGLEGKKVSGDEDHRTRHWMITYQGQYHTPSLSKTMGAAMMTGAHVLCVKVLSCSAAFPSFVTLLSSQQKLGSGTRR